MTPDVTELVVDGTPEGETPSDNVLYYWDYLRLDDILNAQHPKSAERGREVHDEFFFIVVHQTYELWFKQIIVELDTVRAIFADQTVDDRGLSIALSRLARINAIQRLLVHQLDVLETLTPLDFLEFRSLLLPASGFQSVQFRLIENKFGLPQHARITIEGHDYSSTLRGDHVELLKRSETEPSLFDNVNRWLSRTPFVTVGDDRFISDYCGVVRARHDATRATLAAHPEQLAMFEASLKKFDAVLDESAWNEEIGRGSRRLSYAAFMGALQIFLYRDEPVFHLPSRVLTAIIDIDEVLTLWRQRHALMAHRMLGRLTGTAGSGYDYLDETARRYSPFRDLFDVSTYLLPRDLLPPWRDR